MKTHCDRELNEEEKAIKHSRRALPKNPKKTILETCSPVHPMHVGDRDGVVLTTQQEAKTKTLGAMDQLLIYGTLIRIYRGWRPQELTHPTIESVFTFLNVLNQQQKRKCKRSRAFTRQRGGFQQTFHTQVMYGHARTHAWPGEARRARVYSSLFSFSYLQDRLGHPTL